MSFKNIKKFLTAAGLIFFFPAAFFIFSRMSQAALQVVISEIAWMGTQASPTDEWLELYNNSSQETILDGWLLQDGNGETIIKLKGRIAPGAFYLIERTNDSTVSDIAADIFGSWGGKGLSNIGEKILLTDANLNLVDEVDCSNGWLAGRASPEYQTMERIDPNLSGRLASNWATNNGLIMSGHDAKGNPIQGTPRAKNSVSLTSPEPSLSDSLYSSALPVLKQVTPKPVIDKTKSVALATPTKSTSSTESVFLAQSNKNTALPQNNSLKEEGIDQTEKNKLLAAAGQTIDQKKNDNLFFYFIAVVCLSSAVSFGLVYFRRQKNPVAKKPDDNII